MYTTMEVYELVYSLQHLSYSKSTKLALPFGVPNFFPNNYICHTPFNLIYSLGNIAEVLYMKAQGHQDCILFLRSSKQHPFYYYDPDYGTMAHTQLQNWGHR